MKITIPMESTSSTKREPVISALEAHIKKLLDAVDYGAVQHAENVVYKATRYTGDINKTTSFAKTGRAREYLTGLSDEYFNHVAKHIKNLIKEHGTHKQTYLISRTELDSILLESLGKDVAKLLSRSDIGTRCVVGFTGKNTSDAQLDIMMPSSGIKFTQLEQKKFLTSNGKGKLVTSNHSKYKNWIKVVSIEPSNHPSKFYVSEWKLGKPGLAKDTDNLSSTDVLKIVTSTVKKILRRESNLLQRLA